MAESRPVFPLAMRGYDRDAVDAATASYEATIAQLQARLAARDAEVGQLAEDLAAAGSAQASRPGTEGWRP